MFFISFFPLLSLCYLLYENNILVCKVSSLGQRLLLPVLLSNTMGLSQSTKIIPRDFCYVLSHRSWWRAFRSISYKDCYLTVNNKVPQNLDRCKHTLQNHSVFLQGFFLLLLTSVGQWIWKAIWGMGKKIIFPYFPKIPKIFSFCHVIQKVSWGATCMCLKNKQVNNKKKKCSGMWESDPCIKILEKF